MSHVVRPEEYELREVSNLIDGVIKHCEQELQKQDDMEIGLAWNQRFEAAVLDTERISLRFNTDKENWQDELRSITAQGYAQAWFMENIDPEIHWQEILMLGHSLTFAERVTGEQPELNEKEEVEKRWKMLKEELSQPLEQTATEMVRYGFTLSYFIVDELMEKHDLKDLPELNRSEVLEAGENVFG